MVENSDKYQLVSDDLSCKKYTMNKFSQNV